MTLYRHAECKEDLFAEVLARKTEAAGSIQRRDLTVEFFARER
jgi:hypothetical protein